MTIEQYVASLERALSVLPAEEKADALDFYRNYIQEADSPSQAMEQLGSPQQLGERIIAEYCEREGLTRDSLHPKKRRWPWILLILLLTCPISIPLIVVAGVMVAIVPITLGSITFAIGISALAFLICTPLAFLSQFSTGLVFIGLTLISLVLLYWVIGLWVQLLRGRVFQRFGRWVKGIFRRITGKEA